MDRAARKNGGAVCPGHGRGNGDRSHAAQNVGRSSRGNAVLSGEIMKLNGDVLVCDCGSEYTHQFEIDSFFRDIEDGPGTHARVNYDGCNITRFITSPETRRNLINVKFSCEQCKKISVLQICQHKGQTLIEWK